ncbi:hypothetical protein SAMN04487945_2016 [Halobacterium jilantaiense]|uniref:Uncharacterized protein n=1 Tax=Halobacterium jilantaiense TaxID=355548 RepID=A0A1I0PVY5_9EURY|nr:hypothetical protein SAMN04487945_2016 [Halobacterium jilantaiense]
MQDARDGEVCPGQCRELAVGDGEGVLVVWHLEGGRRPAVVAVVVEEDAAAVRDADDDPVGPRLGGVEVRSVDWFGASLDGEVGMVEQRFEVGQRVDVDE